MHQIEVSRLNFNIRNFYIIFSRRGSKKVTFPNQLGIVIRITAAAWININLHITGSSTSITLEGHESTD